MLSAIAVAQEAVPAKPADLETSSLPLRTALYHDPTLTPPLDRLLQLYREANKVKELVGTYRQHVSQYPADIGALTVLVRLLAATNDAEAGKFARAAATQFPKEPFLQFLQFEALQRSHEAGALDALDRAIDLEKLPARKRAWVEQLLPLAVAAGQPERVQKHLDALATGSTTAEGKLEAARKMITYKLYAPALATLDAALALKPSAETGVDLELDAASAELGLDRGPAAATRLDRVLARLAPDYWRRTEILHRRTALVKSDADREAMLQAARARAKAAPDDPGAALELAQLLTAFEFRREALDVLLAASQRIPASEKLEKEALDLFDLLRDERGREAYLAARVKAQPQRQDLALARAKSLLLLNRRPEALAVFEAFLAPLDAATRLNQTLEMARYLRRVTLPADAAAFFERAIAQAPNRLDVRRELAETYLATGQKGKVRELFSNALPSEVETENLLDVVQFLLKQEMYAEAHTMLAARLVAEPQNFDLRLMQITVEGKLADRAAGEKLIAKAFELADTEARYRRWLETAVAFHETFETHGDFLAQEQERLFLSGGGWTGDAGQRRLIFIEVAAAHGSKANVAMTLTEAMSNPDLPAEVKVELRRRQLALIQNDPAQVIATTELLKALEKEDAARADEYRIARANIAARAQNFQEVQSILGPMGQGIDVTKINDAVLLSSFEGLLRQYGGGQPKLLNAILERITMLKPTDRNAWERWLTSLATGADEEKLRTALRQLLEGVDRLPLPEETRVGLREHLLASHWRGVAQLLHGRPPGTTTAEEEPRLAEALPLLDAAGRLAVRRDEWLWIAWTRAFVLNRLERKDARDEAIRELERVAALPVPASPVKSEEAAEPAEKEPAETTPAIAFPDGMVIALGPARELLTTPPGKAPSERLAEAAGPRGPMRARWAFNSDGQVALARTLVVDDRLVLVLDTTGKIYALDRATGKLRWQREGARPAAPTPNEYGNGISYPSLAMPIVEKGRLFLPAGGAIECWTVEDGKRVWRAEGVAEMNAATPLYPTLFAHGDRLLVCDAVRGRITTLDRATGKVAWQRDYPRQPLATPLHAYNAGASYSEGRVLLYGAATVVANAGTGDILWSFESARARTFPVSLAEKSAPPPVAVTGPAFGRGRFSSNTIMLSGGGSWSSFGGGFPGGANTYYAIDYQLQGATAYNPQAGQQIALLNTAASWAAGQNQEAQMRRGLLFGQRMLLFSPNVIRSVRLDLPCSSQQIAANGTFAGMTGRFACLLSSGAVSVLDLDSGTTATIPFETTVAAAEDEDVEVSADDDEVMPQPPTQAVRVAVDGSLLYMTDPGGISAFQARTQQRVFRVGWPKSVAPARPDPAATAATPAQNISGVIMGRNGRYYGRSPQPVNFEPMPSVVAGGVLYVESESGKLVALEADAAAAK